MEKAIKKILEAGAMFGMVKDWCIYTRLRETITVQEIVSQLILISSDIRNIRIGFICGEMPEVAEVADVALRFAKLEAALAKAPVDYCANPNVLMLMKLGCERLREALLEYGELASSGSSGAVQTS